MTTFFKLPHLQVYRLYVFLEETLKSSFPSWIFLILQDSAMLPTTYYYDILVKNVNSTQKLLRKLPIDSFKQTYYYLKWNRNFCPDFHGLWGTTF